MFCWWKISHPKFSIGTFKRVVFLHDNTSFESPDFIFFLYYFTAQNVIFASWADRLKVCHFQLVLSLLILQYFMYLSNYLQCTTSDPLWNICKIWWVPSHNKWLNHNGKTEKCPLSGYSLEEDGFEVVIRSSACINYHHNDTISGATKVIRHKSVIMHANLDWQKRMLK